MFTQSSNNGVFRLFPHITRYIAFFISLKAAITSTGSVFPVFFWISGSYVTVRR